MTIFVGCHTSLSCWDLLYMKMDLIWVCLNMRDISINKAWDQCFDKGIMVYTTNMGKPVVYRYTPNCGNLVRNMVIDHWIWVYILFSVKPIQGNPYYDDLLLPRLGNKGDFPLTRDTGHLSDKAVCAGCICIK